MTGRRASSSRVLALATALALALAGCNSSSGAPAAGAPAGPSPTGGKVLPAGHYDSGLVASPSYGAGISGFNDRSSVATSSRANAYSVDTLLVRALRRSFDSQVEFQKVTEAKANARLAMLNLFPHLSINSIAAVIPVVGISGILKAAGDLLPFLLPSRWFKASKERHKGEAEEMASLLMQADAGQIAESMGYAVLSNEDSLSEIERNRKAIVAVRDRIRERERTGIFQVGTSDEVTAVVGAIDQSAVDLKSLDADEHAALAQAAGFMTPEAVGQVTLSRTDSSVEHPVALHEDSMRARALAQSPELRQLDKLIEAAQSDHDGRIFNWLDPNGDTQGGIGLGLPTYVEIASIQADELGAERRRVQSSLIEKVDQAVNDLRKAVADYHIAEANVQVQTRQADRITSDIELGLSFEMASLVTAMQGRVNSRLAMVEARYLYLTTLGQLDRLLFQRYYSEVAPTQGATAGNGGT